MSERFTREQLAQLAAITDAPARHTVDRTFEVPTGLYVATVSLYLGFIGLMATIFVDRDTAIPMVLFAGFVIAFFGLPYIWTKMAPGTASKALTWGQMQARGIQTLSGHLTAGEAAAQVLILPVLIMAWGLAIAVIVAFH